MPKLKVAQASATEVTVLVDDRIEVEFRFFGGRLHYIGKNVLTDPRNSYVKKEDFNAARELAYATVKDKRAAEQKRAREPTFL